MDITVGEAADAFGVSPDFIATWYSGGKAPRYFGLDSEQLCASFGLDHRFLMAFLVGYDIALSNRQVYALLGMNRECVRKRIRPKAPPVLIVPSVGRLGKHSLVRYSYRRVAPLLAARLEKQNGNHRAYTHGSGPILPAPDLMPPDSWTFRSAIITEGTRLPWARCSVLEDGSASTLPVLDRGARR
jgi:hypothetical protein